MLRAEPRFCHEELNTQTSMRFPYKKGSPNFGQKTRTYDSQQQKKKKKEKKKDKKRKKTIQNVGFAVQADHWISKIRKGDILKKLRQGTKNNKKLRNMKVVVITIVVGAHLTIPNVWLGAGRLENRRTSKDRPNYSIIKIK